jgi:glycerol uptake facilitator-like aquaporin
VTATTPQGASGDIQPEPAPAVGPTRETTATRGPTLAVPPVMRRFAAELLGTAFLVAGVVGSGIMAQRLSDDPGLQLLQNTAATAGVLVALILALGAASGAHFNPAVTLVDRIFGGIDTATAVGYIVAQVVGGILGAIAANAMFDLPAVEWSTTARTGGNLWFAEGVATAGLLIVIFGVVRAGRGGVVAFAVAGYIAGAYWFTSSTSFANPAVTVGRAFSDTFAGIEPASVPMFVVAQLVGAAAAAGLIAVIYPHVADVAGDVVVPHDGPSSTTSS